MKKRVLFIDRDGTLIKEPPVDFQVDSLEKLEFVAGVFRNLYFIRKKIDFEFVIVTNQDGLGTDSFPEEKFWPVQNKMLQAFANEGIVFDAIYIDKSFPEENVPTRKPGTAMLTSYFTDDYDLSESYVIGDRLTDIQLAENLGAKAIFMGSEDELKKIRDRQLIETCVCVAADWDTIYSFLASRERKAIL